MLTTQHQNRSRRERPLDEAERAAIDKHGLHNLGDFRPKEPTEAEVKIIGELFAKSVEGEAYDLEQYGQYFRPAGVAYQGKPQVAVPTASAPATVEHTHDDGTKHSHQGGDQPHTHEAENLRRPRQRRLQQETVPREQKTS